MAPEKKFTNISEEFLGNFSAKLSLNAHFNCSNCHFSLFYCISSEWDGGLILVAVGKDEGQDGVMPYFCPQGVLCHENHATQRNREPNKVYFIFFINWLFLYILLLLCQDLATLSCTSIYRSNTTTLFQFSLSSHQSAATVNAL